MSETSQRRIIVKKTRRRRKGGDRKRLTADVLLVLLLMPLLLVRSDVEAKPDERAVAKADAVREAEFPPWPRTETDDEVPVFAWNRDSPGAVPAIFPEPGEDPVFVWARPLLLGDPPPIYPVGDGWLPIPDPIHLVPEPGTTTLLLTCAAAMTLRRKRRQPKGI